MDDFVENSIETLLELEGAVVYWIIGLLAWAEAPFFLGLITPGEMAVAAGGVLASRGQVLALGVGAAAAVGTVVGNSMGYWLGRIWGRRMLEWRPLQRTLGVPIEKTREFFLKRGEWAIVGGRISHFTRVFVPFIAGSSGMAYRRFLLYDVPTGVVWAFAWVGIGFSLGESWRALLATAGPAAFLVLILFVAALVIGWVARRVARGQNWVVAGSRFVMTARPTVWLLRRVRGPARWIGRRFDPGVADGLQLTFGFLALVGGAAVVGLALGQTRAVAGLALLDFPVLEWMVATRTAEAVAIARTGLQLFHLPGVAVLTLVLFLAGWGRDSWQAGLRAATGIAGAACGAWLLDRLVLEGVVPNAEFPSVPVAVAGALLVHLIVIAGKEMDWGKGVTAGAVGVFLICAVALGSVVAGIAAPSGIVLGLGIGLVWATILEVPPRIPASNGPPLEGAVQAGVGEGVRAPEA